VGAGVGQVVTKPFGRDREKAGQNTPASEIWHPSFEGEFPRQISRVQRLKMVL